MHPLFNDYLSLDEKQLYEKLQDLSKKYWMTSNEQIKFQIQLVIDDIKLELSTRSLKDKQKSEELDKLINIS